MAVWYAGNCVSDRSAASFFKIRADPLLSPLPHLLVAANQNTNGDVMDENNHGRCDKYGNFYFQKKDEMSSAQLWL